MRRPLVALVIAPQWIGDAVMTEPLLRRLSARGERLTVLAVPWVSPIYEAMSHITGLQAIQTLPLGHGGLQWQTRCALAARIRAGEWGRFERAYVLPNSLKSALIPWWAGIPTRIGYKGEQRYGLINRRLANPSRDQRGGMVEHYLALAQETARDRSSDEGDASLRPRLSWPDVKPNHLTLIVPGAEYGPAKRWDEDHFAQLVHHLVMSPSPSAEQQTPRRMALLGSAKEAALCQAIVDKACRLGADPSRIENLAGQTTLTQAIALIAGAAQMVSNDSGLMHVAAAFGIRQVAIFGSSSPAHTPPLNPRAKILWRGYTGLECTPCYRRECPKQGDAHLACLRGIEVTDVVEALGVA